jgi:hypothetical protein
MYNGQCTIKKPKPKPKPQRLRGSFCAVLPSPVSYLQTTLNSQLSTLNSQLATLNYQLYTVNCTLIYALRPA